MTERPDVQQLLETQYSDDEVASFGFSTQEDFRAAERQHALDGFNDDDRYLPTDREAASMAAWMRRHAKPVRPAVACPPPVRWSPERRVLHRPRASRRSRPARRSRAATCLSGDAPPPPPPPPLAGKAAGVAS